MNKHINIIVGAVAVLAVVFGVAYLKPTTVQVNVPTPVQEQSSTSYGAVPTLDGVDNPNIRIGGVREYSFRAPYTGTSSVLTYLKNPWSATSTIVFLQNDVTTGLAGTNTVDISTTSNSTCYGSSTPALIYGRSIASLAQDTAVWTPWGASTSPIINGAKVLLNSETDGTSDYILRPNECITVRVATSSAGTFGTYATGALDIILRR